MKGSTTIKINQATMIEAVQMYLDAQLSNGHTVTSVKAMPSGAYADQGCFEIEFSEREINAIAKAAQEAWRCLETGDVEWRDIPVVSE